MDRMERVEGSIRFSSQTHVTPRGVVDLWNHVATLRAKKGDREGVKSAWSNARIVETVYYPNRPT